MNNEYTVVIEMKEGRACIIGAHESRRSRLATDQQLCMPDPRESGGKEVQDIEHVLKGNVLENIY
jgi:hypothetical protein